MTDARERRRQRAESQKRADVSGAIKKYRIPIIIVAIWAAVIALNVAQAQGVVPEFGEDCPGHWHSTFDVFVEDDHVAFTQNPAYTLEGGQGMSMRIHMHRGSEGVWHFEPPTKRCLSMADAMDAVDMEVASDRLVLEGAYHEQAGWGGTHEADENRTVQAFYRPHGGDWEEISIDRLNSFQPADGSKVMVAYGNHTAEDIEAMQGQTRSLPGNLEPDAGVRSKFIPMMMVTIFAVLAVVLWYNFAKKTW